MSRTRLPKPLLISLVAAELASAVLAWRNLAGRGDGEVRGGKRLWRALMLANPGNSIAYWLIGRRRSDWLV